MVAKRPDAKTRGVKTAAAKKPAPKKAATRRRETPIVASPSDIWAAADEADDRLPERGTKVSEIVARQIVRDIAQGRIAPGSMLPPEATMLERFRIGRASMREALRILEVYGLITIKPGPGGGPIVREVTSRQFARTSTFYFHLHGATFRDLLEARRAIEPLMARLAAQNRLKGPIAELKGDIAAAREALEATDRPSWTDRSGTFHERVAGASGNHILDLFGQSLKDLWTDRLEHRIVARPDAAKVMDEHEAIADAIVGGRADEAERLMSAHMETFTKIVTKQAGGVLDELLDWR